MVRVRLLAALVCFALFVPNGAVTTEAPTTGSFTDATEKPDVEGFFKCGKRPREENRKEEKLVRKLLELLGGPAKQRRIVDGEDAWRGQYPWQAGLAMKNRHANDTLFRAFCGGTIIAPTWVITASHCVISKNGRKDASQLLVSVGDHHRSDDHENDEFHEVKAIYNHPLYNHYATLGNDITMIELKRPINFNDFVQPACLPAPGQHPTPSHCLTSGWGVMGHHERNQPNVLMGVKISISSKEHCRKYLRKTWPYLRYMADCQLDAQLCAGLVGTRSPCFGDSGGPLVCREEDGFTLFGVTSYTAGCGLDQHPGVYSSVSSHLRFIADVMAHAEARSETRKDFKRWR